MILTVTLNPAIDKILVLNKFEVHKLHRRHDDEVIMSEPGGKGVNIALTLKFLGNDVIATGFAGGHSGHMLCDHLRQKGITTSFVFTSGITRTNTSILDRENETLTEINDIGQNVEDDDIQFFLKNYERLLQRVKFVVIAGSLPGGVSVDLYRKMIVLAKKYNLKVIVHMSPIYLDTLINTSPFLVIPDMRSFHKLFGKHIDGIEQFIEVGKDILIKNLDTEFVIFTHRIENVVAITREKSYILRPKDLKIINMLGYADSYLAGFIHAYKQNKPIIDVLKYASAIGLTNIEVLYKEISDMKKITKNLLRIEVEERK